MLDKVTETVAKRLLRENVIKQEDYEIYVFGLKQLIMTTVNLVTTIVVGIIVQGLMQAIIFIIAFMVIRSNAGGYHATTPFRCYVLSTLTIFLTLSAIKYIKMDIYFLIFLLFWSSIVILALAPVDTKNKPLDNLEYNYYRKKTRIVWSIETLIVIVCVMLQFQIGAISITYSQVVLSVSLISEKCSRIIRKKKHSAI